MSDELEFTLLDCAAFDMHWRDLARKDTAATMWLITDEEAKARIRQEFVDAFNQRISDRRNELAAKTALSQEDENELSALLINSWFPITVETAEAYLQSLPKESLADKLQAWKEFELAQLQSRNVGNPTAFFVPESIVKPLVEKPKEPALAAVPKTPAQQIRDWLFERGAKCLWERAGVANQFHLECYGLNGRIFILQVWRNQGVEVYAPVGDVTIVGTIDAMEHLVKPSKRCEALVGEYRVHGTIDDDDELTLSVNRPDGKNVFDVGEDLGDPKEFMVRIGFEGNEK